MLVHIHRNYVMTLMEERRLQDFEERVLGMFGPMRDEMTGGAV
jgi:hypothetical protein